MTPPKNRLPLAGSERSPMPGAREVGPANPNEKVEVTIRLKSRAGKKPIVSADAYSQLPKKRTTLSRAEYEQRHGADPAAIARVEAFARDHALTVVETSPARRTVILSGTVAAMNDAFGVVLKQYEHRRRKISRPHRRRATSSRSARCRRGRIWFGQPPSGSTAFS